MSTMTADDIRNTILAELRRRKWSNYRLVQELKGRAPEASIYRYLSGTSDITSNVLSAIFGVLNLYIAKKGSNRQY